ncbi:IPT/TIG domain-containing protein [Flavitalea sp. BT771]|uniref:IPT/TIG domain-containing protein n=1 Tax=Flavitalea sp. BT771 TaxID=3063329 RepID=UPI0026E22238|nr:IPT/TIG domain-containing protein [Flavitalea sp. BT771]MDO6430731.1 IPT/TIG domain-containing protein [Flavitalea sp. BT771]MDV6219129.1 IPT/TIG domain-containing protein [Flavitalea sp. BT771]
MQRTIKIFLVAILAGLSTGMLSCKKDAGTGHHPGSPIKVDSFTATSGGVGTEVLISGSNFSSDTSQIKVFVNGHQLALVGANARQIMAVIPAKCGSGHVIVKIGGDSAVSTGVFNYTFSRVVSTLAGNGTAGFANGQGTDAKFNFSGEIWYRSQGIVVDDNLNVYVADPGNHCIRKIDSLGNVSTLVGDPTASGYADGQGSAAKFSLPYDLALDADGNLYSGDAGNWDVRKISPDGTAVTWAWGSQAPWSVAVDKTTGYVYYSSCDNPGNIYQITAQSTASEVIHGLNYPAGIKFDKAGNLYVSCNGDQVVYKFDQGSWNKTVIAGTMGSAGYANGAGTAAKFAYPWGLAIDNDGNLLLGENGTWNGDTGNPDQSIRYIAADTRDVSTFAGSNSAGYADGIGEAASFSAPIGVAVDKNGTVYVLDKNNNRVRKIISL